MDLRAKYLSETCSDPIEYLRQLRQTTEPIGGGTEYCEDGELVEYDVAIEAVRKANDAFIEEACDAYCAICDTKECHGCAECSWVIKFRKQLIKMKGE